MERYHPLNLPKTPGHEIAGWIEEVGKSVPENIMKPDDLVVVFGGGVVVGVYTVSQEMNNFVILLNGPGYHLLTEDFLNTYSSLHIDF